MTGLVVGLVDRWEQLHVAAVIAQRDRRTDGRTDGRTRYRYIDAHRLKPAASTIQRNKYSCRSPIDPRDKIVL